MIPKERIFLKGDVMNALNIRKNQNTPKLGNKMKLQIAINKLAYNLRVQSIAEQKSKPEAVPPKAEPKHAKTNSGYQCPTCAIIYKSKTILQDHFDKSKHGPSFNCTPKVDPQSKPKINAPSAEPDLIEIESTEDENEEMEEDKS